MHLYTKQISINCELTHTISTWTRRIGNQILLRRQHGGYCIKTMETLKRCNPMDGRDFNEEHPLHQSHIPISASNKNIGSSTNVWIISYIDGNEIDLCVDVSVSITISEIDDCINLAYPNSAIYFYILQMSQNA